MPKKTAAKRMDPSRVELVSGRKLISGAATGGTVNILALQPAMDSRLNSIAANFQFYRFTNLKVSVFPCRETGVAQAATAAAYANGSGFDTPPSTVVQLAALPYFKLVSDGQSIPASFSVSRSELLKDSQIPWFKTIQGTPASGFEIQGNIYHMSVNATFTTEYYVLIDWECELSQWNASAQAPFVLVDEQLQLYRKAGAGSGEQSNSTSSRFTPAPSPSSLKTLVA